MLHWRLILSGLFIPSLLLVVLLEHYSPVRGAVLAPVGLALANVAVQEMLGLFQSAGLRASRWVCHTGATVVIVATILPHCFPAMVTPAMGLWGWSALGLAAAIGLAFWDGIWRYREPPESLSRFGLATVVIAYVGWLFTFLFHLLWIGDGGLSTGDRGPFAIASLVLIVKLGDVGAYTVGRIMGRTKLAPRVSPGKTLEGFVGGLAFSLVGAWFAWRVLGPWWMNVPSTLPWPQWCLFAAAAYAAGVLGDLAESLLKRSVGRKDSSLWMPGFGGVLDLVDSVLMAAPIAFLFWGLGWVRL